MPEKQETNIQTDGGDYAEQSIDKRTVGIDPAVLSDLLTKILDNAHHERLRGDAEEIERRLRQTHLDNKLEHIERAVSLFNFTTLNDHIAQIKDITKTINQLELSRRLENIERFIQISSWFYKITAICLIITTVTLLLVTGMMIYRTISTLNAFTFTIGSFTAIVIYTKMAKILW